MASIAGSSISFATRPQARLQSSLTTMKPSVSFLRMRAPRFQSAPLRLQISCAAKQETIETVSEIVRKQLALEASRTIDGETKFSDIGADSLDTVEIVMKLEEEFGVQVEEENAQSITTIGEAAELIETLKSKCN